MACFLLFFLTFWTQKRALRCCWQPSPGSVSPLHRAARFSAACKQALLFIVWAGREEAGGGAVGTWRERWSQHSGMCLGKPRVDTAQMTARESLAEGSRGTPFNTSSPFPPPSLFSLRRLPLSLSPLVCLVLSVSRSLSPALESQPACLP